MNIKHKNSYISSSSKSNLKSIVSIKKYQNSQHKSHQKEIRPEFKNNIKSNYNQQKIMLKVKSPPFLKRQNTEESPQIIKISMNTVQSQQIQTQKSLKKNSQRKKHEKCFKVQSDQQSTNIYKNCLSSCDEEIDPYKISQSHKINFYKQKSIQPSRDFTISLMSSQFNKMSMQNMKNNNQKQKIINEEEIHKLQRKKKQDCGRERMIQNKHSLAKSKSLRKQLINDVKDNLKQSLKNYKQLIKHHQKEYQHFRKEIGITKDQLKRLCKIHQIQQQQIKSKIFQLKDQMEQNIQLLK